VWNRFCIANLLLWQKMRCMHCGVWYIGPTTPLEWGEKHGKNSFSLYVSGLAWLRCCWTHSHAAVASFLSAMVRLICNMRFWIWQIRFDRYNVHGSLFHSHGSISWYTGGTLKSKSTVYLWRTSSPDLPWIKSLHSMPSRFQISSFLAIARLHGV